MKKSLLLCLTICLVKICKTQTFCVAEEGSTFNLTCSNPFNISDVTHQQWTVVNSSNNATVISQCSLNNVCNNTYAPALTSQTIGNRSILTITKVSRTTPFNMETKWICQWLPHVTVNVCPGLSVYVRPQNVSCVFQPLNATTNRMMCTTERVYPTAFCSIVISRDNVSFTQVRPFSVSYNHTIRNETPVYYKTSCTLILEDRLFLGKNYLKVRMNPSVSSGQLYFVESQVFVVTTVISEYPPTQGITTPTLAAISTRSKPTSAIEVTTPKQDTQSVAAVLNNSESGLTIGLGVAFAISATIAIVLCALMMCYWLRHKQRMSQKLIPARIPEQYDRVNESPQNPEATSEYQYEDMNNTNAAPVDGYEQPRRVGIGEQSTYANLAGNDQNQEGREPTTYVNLNALRKT